MVAVTRLLVALAVASLSSAPLYADVIPTRRASDCGDSSKKVESRLLELGVSTEAAKNQVQKLTDDQTRYFASNPHRVQLVGQEIWAGQADMLWWEWVFGIATLVGVAIFIIIEINNT